VKKPETFKKIGMFTDIHFGRRSNSKVHNQDCLDHISWFCNEIQVAGDYSHIVFLGDWFESRSAINIETMEYSYDGLKLLNSLEIPVYFIVGNHDLHRRTTRDVHSVRMFQELTNIIVVDKPIVIDHCLFSPFLFEPEYGSMIAHNNLYAWFGHFEFMNFVITGYNTVMDHGPNHKIFNGPNKIFSGHFHKRQIQDNVYYIGNAFPMDFGDAGDSDRGMATYDVLADKVTFKNWDDCPTYSKTMLSKVMDDDWEHKPKMKVKCVIDVDLPYSSAQELREGMIEMYQLRDFVLEEDRATKQGLLEGDGVKVTDDIGVDFTSIDDLVIKQLELAKEDKKSTIDVNMLIEIYKNLQVDIIEGEED
jgi:DNA repair exonuclease SbcCD nuclease subunit